MEALPLPQTKQSRWHNSTRGLAKQPRRRSPWTSRKRLHFLNSLQGPGCLAKSGLCLPWLASGYQKKRFGWLLASGWTSPCLQTKQSRWHNSTRGLAKQPRRRSRLGRPEKGCTINCWFGWLLAIKKRGLVVAGWLAFWLDIPLPGKILYLPG